MPASTTILGKVRRAAHLIGAQADKVGVIGTARWLSAVALRRAPRDLLTKLPGRLRCNCCGWHGLVRLPSIDGNYLEFGTTCPNCASMGRHRFLTRILAEEPAGRTGRCLWFAPEPCLDRVVRQPGLVVERSDPFVPGLEHAFDLQAIDAPDASYDLIVCIHVVEHVERDRQAMAELARILRPGGLLCLAVPMDDTQPVTVEFGAPNPDKCGHWRDYGADFRDRIPAELRTRECKASAMLTAKERETLGIHGREIMFLCEKVA